jgi:hypothetical protein
MSEEGNAGRLGRAGIRVAIRAFAFCIIAGLGVGLMYFADDFRHMVAVGVAYLIMMCAVLVVAAADAIEDRILMRVRSKA